jgi:hypothetical protein
MGIGSGVASKYCLMSAKKCHVFPAPPSYPLGHKARLCRNLRHAACGGCIPERVGTASVGRRVAVFGAESRSAKSSSLGLEAGLRYDPKYYGTNLL